MRDNALENVRSEQPEMLWYVRCKSLPAANKLKEKIMTTPKIGETVVSDRGIERVIEVEDCIYTSEILITKETFVEAYNQWIKCNNNEIDRQMEKYSEN